jgi:branched-chain amino acid transport system permease protein
MKWYVLPGFAVVGIALYFFPLLKDTLDYPAFLLIFLYLGFFWIAQATSWNILTGYSGYFSFGQGAFYGIGVYTTAVMITKYEWNYILTLPIAGLLAMLLGLVIGVTVFRMRQLKGELFALLTLAVAFVVSSVVSQTDYIDGGQGMRIGRVEYPDFLGSFPEMMYRLGLIIALMSVFIAYLVYESVAEGLGVPTFRYKMIAFAISTFLAGFSGGLHAVQLGYVEVAGVFNLTVPLFVILMSILGGRRFWMGPIIGAIVITSIDDAFSNTDIQFINDLVIGGLLITMILFVPEGVFDRLRYRWLPALVLGTIMALLMAFGVITDIGQSLLDVTVGGRITEKFAGIILIVVLLTLIPERFYPRPTQQFKMKPDPHPAPVIEGD